MSIFSTILDKLGIHAPAAPAAPAAKPATGSPSTSAPAPSGNSMTWNPVNPMVNKPATPASSTPTPAAAPMGAPKPAMSMVDVVSKLDKMASGSPGLDWKVSIVDMLKLLGMDSSLSARKELATELGCPADLMGGDYAKMNVWLHQAVLQKIAENGGNIPQSLLS